MNLWDNDAAKAFFKTNGYKGTYNDAMYRWLQDFYSITGSTLPDLLARYLRENGPTLIAPATAVRLLEDGNSRITEDGELRLLET